VAIEAAAVRPTGLRRVVRKHPNSHREAKAAAPVLDSTREALTIRSASAMAWFWTVILNHDTLTPKQCAPSRAALPTESVFTIMKKNVWRAVIEVAFIIFLFYSNLLMGEFERSGMGQKRGVAWAIEDIFTAANFEIAMIAALIGYGLVEFLRKRF